MLLKSWLKADKDYSSGRFSFISGKRPDTEWKLVVKTKKLLIICTVLAALLASAGTVYSATYGVTSRADLSGDDYVDWGRQGYGEPYYGGPHSAGPYVRIPVPAFSEGGIGLNVTNPPYNGSILSMSIRKQSLSWFGCFAPGDVLIGNQWDVSGFITGPAPDYMITDIGPGPVTIHFDVPVYGLGAQINKWQNFAGTFNAIIEAFDSDWNTLGQVSFNNLQFTRSADNSAPFIGILCDTASISHVVIATGRSAHMVNLLDMVTVNPATFPPTGAIPSSPGTAGGVALITSGANANDPVTPDTTAGAMLVNNETYLEDSEYTIADLSVDSVVQTSAFTGEIHYNGNRLVSFRPPANPVIWGDYALLPIDVRIDGASASLTDLDGQEVRTLRVVLNRGSGFVPELNDYHQTFQYLVSAALSNNNGGACQCPPDSAMGCISGTVRGLDGQPLAGKTVKAIRVRPKPKVKLNNTVTDADGCYLFPDLENGKYKIKVKGCKGGGRKTVRIKRGSKTNNVDFQCN